MKRSEWVAILVTASLLVPFTTLRATEDPQATLFQTSVEQESKGAFTESLATLDQISGPRANGYMVRLRRGWLLYMLGRWDASIAAYSQAVKTEPGSVEARLGMMLPQLAARKWSDAISTGLEVLKKDPANYLANSRIAYASYNLGKWTDAEKYYRAVLDLYPGDIDMRSGYAWSLLKQGRYAEAKTQFLKILEVSPHHPASNDGLKLCP